MKITGTNEPSDPVAPDSGRVTLYPKGDQWFARTSGGVVTPLAGAAILFGTGAPAGGLGKVGDFYQDTANGDVYEKTASAVWTFRDNITGPQGIQGDPGDPGPPGGVAPASSLTPLAISDSAGAVGSASPYSREDHVHPHGTRGGGTLHAAATTSVAGFISAADKVRVDGIEGLADGRITVQKGAASGLASLDVGGKVPAAQLPSYVDDVEEYANLAAFPVTGETGKIYVALDSNKTYRWTGSVYVEISASLVLGTSNPLELTDSTPSAGSASTASKEDHVHPHGTRGGGTLHAAATTSVAGFISAADKTKLDGVASGATATPLSASTPLAVASSGAPGSGTAASKDDHVHAHGNQAGGALHALADAATAGFLSAADFLKLAALYSPVSTFAIDEHFAAQSEVTERIGIYGWLNGSAGTGNNQTRLAGQAGHPGIFRLQGGTVATARSVLNLGGAGFHTMVLGGGEILFRAIVRMTGTINTHLQSAIGLGDSFTANGDQANGVYIRLLGSGSSYELITASGSVRSAVTALTYVSADWVDIGFLINSAGTSVQAQVNGANVGSALTTNIPAIALSPFIKTDAIAAGTALSWDTDRFFMRQSL